MKIERFPLGPIDNNTYLIIDEATNEAAIVDPSFESETLWPTIEEKGLSLRYILNTHAHFDHVVGNGFFAEKSNAPIALHREDLEILHKAPEHGRLFGLVVPVSPEPTIFLDHGQTLTLGELNIEVRFTPGHAPGHVTFVVEDAALGGDCLFARSIGRTDLPGASQQTLLHSIRTQLLSLPDETRVFPGHGPTTTVGRERRQNPFLKELWDE